VKVKGKVRRRVEFRDRGMARRVWRLEIEEIHAEALTR
jgi:hypothetical protein